MEGFGIWVIAFVALVLLWFILYFIPIGLWFSALVSGVRISLLQLVLMRFRKVPPSVIVNQMIAGTKAGLHLTSNDLEAHFLAGGNVPNVVTALISAQKANITLDFRMAAAIDLARLAGLQPAGALIEIMNEDGTMARLPQLLETAKKFDLKIISIASLIAYRLREESIIEKGVTVPLPTEWGEFQITPFRQKSNGVEHVALTKGEWTEDEPVLVRVHSSCATGDIFGSYRCDCGEQLHKAMEMIDREGRGAVVYLNQEGRGIGLCNKIHAYKLQDEGLDTVDANLKLGFKADERDYGVGASIIRELGIRHMRLMTNNPLKRAGLEGYGLCIDEIVPIVIAPNPYNAHYLETKQERMHHTLGLEKR